MAEPSGFAVLTVCTANICRSPTAAWALRSACNASPGLADLITVGSAGVAADAGRAMCQAAASLAGTPAGDAAAHRSRLLTAQVAESAQLILTADRSHRSASGRLAPSTRARLFTLRQAADLASWVIGSAGTLAIAAQLSAGIDPDLPAHDPRHGVPALPMGSGARLVWLVAEMDAARGSLASTGEDGQAAGWHPQDIPDPHVAGWHMHADAVTTAVAAAHTLVAAFSAVESMA